MRTNFYLQNNIKFNLFHTSSVSRSSISHLWYIFLALLRSVTLTAMVPRRPLQVFALTPDIQVERTKRNRNKDLTMNILTGKIFATNLCCSSENWGWFQVRFFFKKNFHTHKKAQNANKRLSPTQKFLCAQKKCCLNVFLFACLRFVSWFLLVSGFAFC